MAAIKNQLQFLTCIFIMCFSISCSKENEEDLLPTGERCEEAVSLSNDILPIINQNCAVAGCHVSGTSRIDLSLKENVLANANQIRSFTQSGFMPMQGSGFQLSPTEKENIFCWVENGANDD